MFLTRWPFRSVFLFSWDSANYALAMERIDVAAHRPHPPGYLAYIAVGRAIDSVIRDANASLVAWNIVATMLAILFLVRLAWEVAEGSPRRLAYASGAGVVVGLSPLLWFYGEVAEIYVSEMLAALAIVYTSWRVSQGRAGALYWSAACVPVAAAFKLTTAVLLLPMVLYAWRRASGPRLKAGALFAACAAAIAGAFLWITPDLAAIVWQQFESSTSGTRLIAAAGSDVFETFNQNSRNVLIATIAMLGPINLLALLYWTVRDRQLPAALPRPVMWLWMLPWLFVSFGIHIAKPGYLLPLLPLAALILGHVYARQNARVYAAVLTAQAALNVAHFAMFGPLPPTVTGGSLAYRQKTLLQRLASDLQPLTVSTAATIRQSDFHVERLLAAVDRTCPSRRPSVIAATQPVDARRVMWYLPDAVVILTEGRRVQSFTDGGVLKPVPREPVQFESACPVLWLVPDNSVPEFALPATATRVPGVGYAIEATSVRITSTTITFATDRSRP